MSVGNTHRLYLVGPTPESAIKNSEVFTEEKSVQEGVIDGFNIYSIDATLFASRLKPVEKWD
jgi:hypothetical protein